MRLGAVFLSKTSRFEMGRIANFSRYSMPDPIITSLVIFAIC